MKLEGWHSLLIVTVIFTAFLIGIFCGRMSAGHQLPISGPTDSNNGATDLSLNLEDTRTFIDGKLNINQAGVEELTLLPGIGETTAGQIIDYRSKHGPFTKIEDLTNVNGIGDSRLSKIRDYITVGG